MNHFNARIALVAFLLAFAGLVYSVEATVVLSGGGLTLVDEGPAALAAGDVAPVNLANSGTAFALDQLGGFGHFITEVNDGVYGNASSWIGNGATGTSGPFIGIDLGAAPTSVSSIAFGRSNVISGDPCAGGVCTDRHLGLYTLQFTAVANPNAATPDASWTTIGTLDYQAAGGDDNFNAPHQRHVYNFNPVNATGIRLIVPASGLVGGTAVDEIELFADPSVEALRLVEIGPAFSAVPANLANNPGATAFAKDVLPGFASHNIPNLNDGVYGNSDSWIGNSLNSFAGIDLGGGAMISQIAWGRDNGGEANQFQDRTAGTYIVQFTTAPNPDETTADPLWTTIGSVTYDPGNDDDSLRHLYEFDPVFATGIRIIAPGNGIVSGAAIDEIEVFAAPVPEPATVTLLLAGLAGVGVRRRRRVA